MSPVNIAVKTQTKRGALLELNGLSYRNAKKSKRLWNYQNDCCPSSLIMTDDDIVITNEDHVHPQKKRSYIKTIPVDDNSKGVIVHSRNGNKNLLFRQFAYRKQYDNGSKIRWVCSTSKYCRACVFSDEDLRVVSWYPQHCHEPPKFYRNNYDPKVDVAVISNLGTILELNGYVYKKTDEFTNDGTRWVCNVDKCHAFLIMNDDDEIISAKELHSHAAKKKWKMTTINDKSKGELVTSRNGNQNLMYRRFAYRKKYTRGDKIRWVCATMKYCRACLHTNESLLVLKAYQEHCHAPPKYNYK